MAQEIKHKLCMGPNTLEISPELFQLNRKRLVEALRKQNLTSVVLLQGGSEIPFYDTDTSYLFRQESYFTWLFGVTEADCYGVVDVQSGEAHLFVPRLPEAYAVWMGPLHTLEDFSKKYDIGNVYYTNELTTVLKKLAKNSELLVLSGVNSDSGLSFKEPTFDGIEEFKVNNKDLTPIVADLRVYKTDLELEVIKYVVEVSSAAHRKVMRFAKPGLFEYQCEAEFLNHCYAVGGCRHVGYTCICGSGVNGAVLHYGHAGAPNNYPLKETDMCLFDMGGSYFGYTADITCSFPASGKFTPDQKMIYEAVLAASLAVFEAAKPTVSWRDMHVLANRVLLEKLKEGGLLKGDVTEMLAAGLAATFQPHGLGHFMGLDVHDVGGYLNGQPERCDKPGLKNLRTARILDERMVLTIEPGCYFIDPLLDAALSDEKLSKFLVPEHLKRFRNFGGVRIEDDVVITKEGCVNLTKVPRTVEEIENWIAGKDNEKYN
ncbi:unnamed protein product [Brassicogethes aeneus]|uniref:Xaa-Pro dipeptidase n=1 Tax=Brassicogethes aeneus TaxID=1431903 RepID=A0A9P0BEZ6_BRAAE|nr:unnamed protein product [Brassicogethes aeneus]